MKKAPMRTLKPDIQIQEYALAQVSDLIRRTAFRANRAGLLKTASSVHDLRVSIRRFVASLRAFGQFMPQDRVRRVRRRLKSTMHLASDVRNYDVATGLLRRTGLPVDAPLMKIIAEERNRVAQALSEELKLWSKKDFQQKWRSRLGL
jgi:CHAD domain-containing protein